MSTPTHITIENQFESIQNLPYPAITLCSPNQITSSAVQHLKQTIVTGNLSFNFDELVAQALGLNEIIQEVNAKKLNEFQDILTDNRYTVVKIMTLLAQSCNSFLKRCHFQSKLYPCEELFDPVLTDLGLCCTFNSIYKFSEDKRNVKKPNFMKHKVQKNGFKHGLTVVADYNPDDAFDNTIQHAGATRTIFTDWSDFPVEVESTLAPPGVEVFHIISATFTYCSDEVKQLPEASRKCLFSTEVALPYFEKYRHVDCELSCFIRKVESHCQCLFPYVPNVSPHRVCNFTKIPCIMDVKYQMSEMPQITACGCQRDCVSRHYVVDHYHGNLDAIQHVMLNHRYADVVLNESSTVMHFFFPKGTFVKQKQETVLSLTILFSNLGGVFGLCLGCSCISVFEISFYIYVAIKNYIQKRRRKGRRRPRFEYNN